MMRARPRRWSKKRPPTMILSSVPWTWKLSDAAAQGLCYFDGMVNQTLLGKLEQVKDQKAVFTVAGEARGIFAGADVVVKVNATGIFDVAVGRIVSLTWTQQDDRKQ